MDMEVVRKELITRDLFQLSDIKIGEERYDLCIINKSGDLYLKFSQLGDTVYMIRITRVDEILFERHRNGEVHSIQKAVGEELPLVWRSEPPDQTKGQSFFWIPFK